MEVFNQNDYYNNNIITHQRDIVNKKDDAPISSGGIPLLQDPFTINFSYIRNYFNTYFKTDYGYIREEFSKNISSGDNLLLYKSLEKLGQDFDESETLNAYINLKSTPLWSDGNGNFNESGFIRFLNGTTGDVIDNKRYLIDNLMPIFLLLENVGQATPNILIEELFNLINSSIFWDGDNGGFLEFNSSSSEKDTKSNLYSILANLLIYQFFKDKPSYLAIANRAFDLANLTIIKLMDEMWDEGVGPGDIGFYNRADPYWNTIDGPQRYKHLDVNALGIITLIDFWIATGMDNNSLYFKNATILYEKLDEQLWETSIGAYNFSKRYDWDLSFCRIYKRGSTTNIKFRI